MSAWGSARVGSSRTRTIPAIASRRAPAAPSGARREVGRSVTSPADTYRGRPLRRAAVVVSPTPCRPGPTARARPCGIDRTQRDADNPERPSASVLPGDSTMPLALQRGHTMAGRRRPESLPPVTATRTSERRPLAVSPSGGAAAPDVRTIARACQPVKPCVWIGRRRCSTSRGRECCWAALSTLDFARFGDSKRRLWPACFTYNEPGGG